MKLFKDLEKYENDPQEQNELFTNIKKKKNPKFFNREEIKEIKKIENENENYEEKRLKRFLFNYNKYNLPPLSSLSQKNLLDNNAILIRPNIFSSDKQIQYEKEKNGLNEEYLQLLIHRLVSQHHNENIIIGKRKEEFNNYMEHLKLLKLKEKFNIGKKKLDAKNELTYYNKKKVKKEKESDNVDKNEKEKKRNCLLIIYEKVWNFCLKSPMEPYSVKKKIWAGKKGVFKKQFQDNRNYK